MMESIFSCLRQNRRAESFLAYRGEKLHMPEASDQRDVMRISIVVQGLEGGTFANLGTSLALGFQELGDEVDLVSVRPVSETGRRARPGLSITSLGCPKTSLAVAHFSRYLRTRRPQVVIAMSSIVNLLAIVSRILARTQTCLIITEHTLLSLEPLDHKWSVKMRTLPALIRLLYPYVDGIVAPSWDILNDPLFRRVCHWQLKPHRVIPNPLTWGPWRDAEVERDQAFRVPHSWLTSDRSHWLFVSIGRLARQKGFDTLIRSIARLHERGVPAHAIILGEGPLRRELERLIQQLGLSPFISLPGFVQDPRPYLKASDAFVLASRFEGFGLVLTEAMALGKPTIATRAPGGPREIIQDGWNGLLVPVDDVDSLAKAMFRVIDDPMLAQHLGANAMDSSCRYEPAVIAAQYREFISELLAPTNLTRT